MSIRLQRSITAPIVATSVTVALTIALLVGWTLVIVLYMPVAENSWLLVLGIISFVGIMAVLVLQSVMLVKAILEGRQQTRFIDSVTHELKSPLAALLLSLETLARDDLDEKQRRDVRGRMADDVERLSGFIDDILQANKLRIFRSGMPLSSVVLHETVTRCAGLAERRQNRDGAVRIEVDEALTLETDGVALETVVKNLLDNALKYSDAPSEVRVRAFEEADGGVVLEVVDDGIGIPPEALKHIFRRFYRVDMEAVRRRRGTGLGLFVVQGLVRYLGGRLEVASEGVDRGTTMRLFLPMQCSAEKSGL